MKKIGALVVITLLIFSCKEAKIDADLLVFNAKVYTVNSDFDYAEAFVLKDGKFLDVGTTNSMKARYHVKEIVDAKQKTIVPGLIDAHCHFYNLGLAQNRIDLSGTTSFDEVIQKVIAFQNERNTSFIIGRGWDQNDWKDKIFPTNDTLNKLFPDIPVALTRVDGHAMLANKKALALANISLETEIEGGVILKNNNKLTGLLIDNPMELVEAIIPDPSREEKIRALKDAQKICTKLGLTSVSDAGLSKDVVTLIQELQDQGELDMRIYAMLSNTQENFDYFLPRGILKTDRLNVRSFKIYADGALGSRGACLKETYTDTHNHFGAMVIGLDDFTRKAQQIANSEFQMNTHAIGDSANAVVLQVYNQMLKDKPNRRWRVEHAQIMDESDFELFNENIIPSIQPTHATSDMYWAEDRVGSERIINAYAYKKLLNQSGMVALGTDFPVEKVNPMHTFYAAIARKDLNHFPENGFQIQNALTREETLKGMTIWAAFSNFEEEEKGSIEQGKYADFIILDKDVMVVDDQEIPKIKVLQTFINGKEIK
jgi:hypothetical protein